MGWGFGVWVWGLRFMVWGSLWGSVFMVRLRYLEFRVKGLGCMVWDLGHEVPGSGLGVEDFVI